MKPDFIQTKTAEPMAQLLIQFIYIKKIIS